MGFANVKAWADAATDNGRNWLSTFRKLPASVTNGGQWYDYSVAGGNPVANYYASTPLVAASLDGNRGLFHGPDVAPAHKYVHRLTMMSAAATTTVFTNRQQTMILLDYIMYYPFIDMDTIGEDQLLDNAITLPRWQDGKSVKVMAVCQSPTTGGGRFTINYTNQDGVSNRVSQTIECAAAQPIGSLITAQGNSGGVCPFVPLAQGDTGVRSVESVNFSIANGGLVAIVLVKPYFMQFLAEECRREGTAQENFGAPSEREMIRDFNVNQEVKDGAFLGLIAQTCGGSISNAALSGVLETVWS